MPHSQRNGPVGRMVVRDGGPGWVWSLQGGGQAKGPLTVVKELYR